MAGWQHAVVGSSSSQSRKAEATMKVSKISMECRGSKAQTLCVLLRGSARDSIHERRGQLMPIADQVNIMSAACKLPASVDSLDQNYIMYRPVVNIQTVVCAANTLNYPFLHLCKISHSFKVHKRTRLLKFPFCGGMSACTTQTIRKRAPAAVRNNSR